MYPELGLSDYDASQLTANKVTSDFFEKAVALGGDAKQVSNWLQGEVAQFLNAEGKTLEQIEDFSLTLDFVFKTLANV